MSCSSASKRKTRSERLFDKLKTKDSTEEERNENEGQIRNVAESINDIGVKNSEYQEQEEENISDESDISKDSGDCLLKFKGLLNEIDEQYSISKLCDGLHDENNFSVRCQSALGLAYFCRSPLIEEDFKSIFGALNAMSDQHGFSALSFCEALLMHVLTKQNISVEHFSVLENCILRVAHSVIQHEECFGNNFVEARIVLLGGERYLTAYKLCEEIFSEENFDLNALDVTTLCCSALRNLSKKKSLLVGRNKFTDETLYYIVSMIGKSTREIISDKLIPIDLKMEDGEEISIFSYNANQCLQILEQILVADPGAPCKTLDHEDNSLLHCLTQLLDWCVSSIFTIDISENNLFKVQNSLDKFYLSTMLSILKAFTILSFDTNQYEFYGHARETIETVMNCVMKTFFQSESSHFDVLVLALELLINFSIKSKKSFALVCLQKFHIGTSQEVYAIEALLKILNSCLIKINELKVRPTTKKKEHINESNPQASENNEEHDMDLVLQVADEDLELSTLVSFIGILVLVFMEVKKDFLDFIRGILSHENCLETVAISKKSLQFALMTGGMPPTGVLLLKASIEKLSKLY